MNSWPFTPKNGCTGSQDSAGDLQHEILSVVYDCYDSQRTTDSSRQSQIEVITEQSVAFVSITLWLSCILSSDIANGSKVMLTLLSE